MENNDEDSKIQSNGEQAILEAAEILFSEKGFDAISMSSIAKLARTSKPNIYHHFKSKKALYQEVLNSAARRSSALLDELVDAPGSFSQRLSQFSAGQLKSILAHKRATQLILRETLSGGSQRGREIAQHYVGESFSRLVAMIRQGQQEGEFREDLDPALAAFMIVSGNVFFFQTAQVVEHLPDISFSDDADGFSQGVMKLLFTGLLKDQEDAA